MSSSQNVKIYWKYFLGVPAEDPVVAPFPHEKVMGGLDSKRKIL
jgi:hypothetical protein